MGDGPGGTTPTPAATSPTLGQLSYNNVSLLRDGKPWLPVMGEFHFSRYPANEWRDELLKMKAGGITVVATYVFWIHHEEVQGQFDWSGQRNLRQFVQTCGEVGLPVIVRMGPWCHGEVRNGGMPDWADAMPRKRSADPAFLAAVKPLYTHIADQLKGQLWKDGGPVMGVQVDNEFGGEPAYLLALKSLAREVGVDVPLYIKTGWPAMRRPVPFGELMPLFGAYAEGFWDRTLDAMPGNYWQAFNFSTERIDTAIASDIFGQREAGGDAQTLSYPYLTCELGGGMMSSYHRRIKISPMDVLSIPVVKVGSGSNLPGYYMYHGGTNPDGKTTTVMQETQSRGMWNDLPYKTYDFQAPLGEFGQVRESYHLLRRFHLFLHDYQDALTPMTTTFAAARPSRGDAATLRYAVRSDGDGGFLFVNNYQRGLPMPAKQDVSFTLTLPKGALTTPVQPITVPADSAFVLPFNLKLGPVTITSTTVQPVCRLTDGNTTTAVFAEIPGVPVQLEFSPDSPPPVTAQGPAFDASTTGRPLVFTAGGKTTNVLVLSHEASLRLWRGTLAGKDRLFITSPGASMTTDNTTIRLTHEGDNGAPLSVSVYPAIEDLTPTGTANLRMQKKTDGLFTTFATSLAAAPKPTATLQQTQQAGPLRSIKMGSERVAEQPTDEDFAGPQPAVFKVQLPATLGQLPPGTRALLRLHYAGDVARVYAGDKLLTDNYYNGTPFDLGLWRLPPGTTELTVKILPLQKDAPIYLADRPDFKAGNSIATLDQAECVLERSVDFTAR
jgi:hypothetical protein